MTRLKTRLVIALSLCSSLGLVGCQEVEQPTTVLTQAQWDDVKKHILSEAPTPKYEVGARFDDKIELIGFDVSEPLEAGKPATFTWYWKALDDVDANWKVFVHFDSTTKPLRQNLDHVPVDGLYPTSRWKKGQIIEDIQKVTLRSDMPAGPTVPYIGFWRGTERMDVTNDVKITKEAQPRVIGPTLTIKAGDSAATVKEAKKRYSLRTLPDGESPELKVDGKLDESIWAKVAPLKLSPFPGSPALDSQLHAFISDGNLYVGGRLEDQQIWGERKNRDDETWKEEVIEVFIDVDGDGDNYLELQLTPLGTVFDANFKQRLGRGEGSRAEQIERAKAFNIEGLETAVQIEGTLNNADDVDTAWSFEMKIPTASIPGIAQSGPSLNDEWAVNLYRFDRPAEGKTHAYAWSTEPRGDFHQVDKFGTWRIVPAIELKKPVITPKMMEQIKKNVDLKVRSQPAAAPNTNKTPPEPQKAEGATEGTE